MKTKKCIIGVDFDGTMVTHEFPGIGKGIGAIQWLKKLNEMGASIILWTMRSDEPELGRTVLTEAVDWCTKNGIELFGVNKNPEQDWSTSPKAYCHIYVDDAALGCPCKIADDGRPYVDWAIVGPMLVKWVEDRLEGKVK